LVSVAHLGQYVLEAYRRDFLAAGELEAKEPVVFVHMDEKAGERNVTAENSNKEEWKASSLAENGGEMKEEDMQMEIVREEDKNLGSERGEERMSSEEKMLVIDDDEPAAGSNGEGEEVENKKENANEMERNLHEMGKRKGSMEEEPKIDKMAETPTKPESEDARVSEPPVICTPPEHFYVELVCFLGVCI
jgi:hypothetical protein